MIETHSLAFFQFPVSESRLCSGCVYLQLEMPVKGVCTMLHKDCSVCKSVVVWSLYYTKTSGLRPCSVFKRLTATVA